jgi:glutamate dehydrogenase (NADP+)
MQYVDEILTRVAKENPGQVAFHQAVHEVLTSIGPALEDAEAEYRRWGVLERLIEPERQILFRVPWEDDHGNVQVNKGYRVQFNSAIGPYKGGIRLHPSVNLDIIKFLGFEQTFKNALTGLPLGGAKGGSNFNPKGKSDGEIMRFCQSFMTELYQYIGAYRDVPAGDIGTGEREIGYLFGQYKRLTEHFESTLTGKGMTYGGSLLRTEATGYGLVYLTDEVLNHRGINLEDKKVDISGSGNVALYAAKKAAQKGAKVQTMSDSDGWIYDKDGIDVELMRRLKETERKRIYTYAEQRPSAVYTPGRGVWQVPCDVALPCATQNELLDEDAKNLVANGALIVCEGANMPCTPEAVNRLMAGKVLYVPGKAANAGGVATSGLEMSQNAMRLNWTAQQVDEKLQDIMKGIYQQIQEAVETYDLGDNLMAGANIAGFTKVAKAMIAQGIC